MTEALTYLPLFLLNIALIVLMIRWRGFVSFEGLGLALLAVLLVSDYFPLLNNLNSAEELTRVVLDSRIYPSIIHFIGLLSLAAGLAVIDLKPIPLTKVFSSKERKSIVNIGYFFVIIGLVMKLLSLYGEGVTSIATFNQNLIEYVTAQRKWGGFLDEGLAIFSLGMFFIAAQQKIIRRQVFLFGLVSGVTFAISASRGGIIGIVLLFYAVLWIFNTESLKRWLNPLVITGFVLLVLLTAGYKSQARSRPDMIDLSYSELYLWGVERFADRFSDVGLYDGYSNYVNRVSENSDSAKNGEILAYSLTSWIPHLIYKDKPVHPFRAVGDLVYRDYRVSDADVSAVTLVGTAYADYGVISTILYLFVYGLVLGGLRKITTGPKAGMITFAWYLHFVFIDGYSNFIHGGILNLTTSIALTSGIVGIYFVYAQIAVAMKQVVGRRIAVR